MAKVNTKASAYLRLFLTGFGMGSADIVPGVSGGTVAFIFGIYEELVFSIKKLSGETLKLALRGKIKEAYKSVPFGFLVPLGLGILTALLTLANLITYLLANHPELVWAFFFGLIVASIMIVRKRVVTWDTHDYAAFLVATVGAYILVGMVPVETPATYLAFFLSGFIAIIAMILPGISGSFLLVLMGKYEQILQAVVERNILVLGIVAIGCALGISVFSRILSWLFEKHHDIAIVILTGFMVGSLRKVWPWKETLSTRIDSHGLEIPLAEANVLPPIGTQLFVAILLAILAGSMLIYLERKHATLEQTGDISDKEFVREHQKAIASQKPGKV